MLPHRHVQVLYPALLSLLFLAVILGIVVFLYPTKLWQQLTLAFQEVCLCISSALFLIIMCCHYYNETKTEVNMVSNVLSLNVHSSNLSRQYACLWVKLARSTP